MDSRASERQDAAGRRLSLSPPRPAFLAWGDFRARSSFARSTIPEKNWGLLVVYSTEASFCYWKERKKVRRVVKVVLVCVCVW